MTKKLLGGLLSRCSWILDVEVLGDRVEGHDRRLKKLLRLSMADSPAGWCRATLVRGRGEHGAVRRTRGGPGRVAVGTTRTYKARGTTDKISLELLRVYVVRLSGKKSRTNRFLVHKSGFFFNELPRCQLEWKLDRFFYRFTPRGKNEYRVREKTICLSHGTHTASLFEP
jgi:hypothetical protein